MTRRALVVAVVSVAAVSLQAQVSFDRILRVLWPLLAGVFLSFENRNPTPEGLYTPRPIFYR